MMPSLPLRPLITTGELVEDCREMLNYALKDGKELPFEVAELVASVETSWLRLHSEPAPFPPSAPAPAGSTDAPTEAAASPAGPGASLGAEGSAAGSAAGRPPEVALQVDLLRLHATLSRAISPATVTTLRATPAVHALKDLARLPGVMLWAMLLSVVCTFGFIATTSIQVAKLSPPLPASPAPVAAEAREPAVGAPPAAPPGRLPAAPPPGGFPPLPTPNLPRNQ